jgi:glutathione peroxidase
MKKLLIAALALAALPLVAKDSVYDFKVKNIKGEEVDLSGYKGKVLLIVNVASKCGATPQYDPLQSIYGKYADKGLVVMGFPANNFGGQEPGTEEEIAEFCTSKYSVAFPMFSKVSVKGDDVHTPAARRKTSGTPGPMGSITSVSPSKVPTTRDAAEEESTPE